MADFSMWGADSSLPMQFQKFAAGQQELQKGALEIQDQLLMRKILSEMGGKGQTGAPANDLAGGLESYASALMRGGLPVKAMEFADKAATLRGHQILAEKNDILTEKAVAETLLKRLELADQTLARGTGPEAQAARDRIRELRGSIPIYLHNQELSRRERATASQMDHQAAQEEAARERNRIAADRAAMTGKSGSMVSSPGKAEMDSAILAIEQAFPSLTDEEKQQLSSDVASAAKAKSSRNRGMDWSTALAQSVEDAKEEVGTESRRWKGIPLTEREVKVYKRQGITLDNPYPIQPNPSKRRVGRYYLVPNGKVYQWGVDSRGKAGWVDPGGSAGSADAWATQQALSPGSEEDEEE